MPADVSPSYLFVPDLGPPGTGLALSGSESHYLARVCRARVGDVATATDGRGAAAVLRLTSVGVTVRAEVESIDREERSRRAWMWCGAPEGARADWLVEKLAELGVEVWQPLNCERGEWALGSDRRGRWERLAIAALRQSRGRFLMELREPVELSMAVTRTPAEAGRWVASEQGRKGLAPPGGGLSIGVVGPAAGFAPGEQKTLEAAGFEPIRLADGRLRSETAALAWALWWSLG